VFLQDNNPIRIHLVTYGLLVPSSIFLYQLSLPPQELNEFFHLAAVVPRELTASFAGIPVNQPVPEWTTLIVPIFARRFFAHSGEYAVFVDFGNNVEDRLGHEIFDFFI